MSLSGPLATLESVRRNSVEGLARRLRDTRAELLRREQASAEAEAQALRCEQALGVERAAFAVAQSVRVLQGVEQRLRALEAERAQRASRARQAALALQALRAEVDGLAQALLNAERARRAAASALAEQELEQLRVSALREEEQAEDAARGRR